MIRLAERIRQREIPLAEARAQILQRAGNFKLELRFVDLAERRMRARVRANGETTSLQIFDLLPVHHLISFLFEIGRDFFLRHGKLPVEAGVEIFLDRRRRDFQLFG